MGSEFSALSFGGGVNSTALLVELVDRSEAPNLVLFADTGGERPETYDHVRSMSSWCADRDIEFITVSNSGRGQGDSLEANCLMRKELPSLAYGFKGCSVKWKRQPMDRYLALRQECIDAWSDGRLVTRFIGVDAGESHRAVLTTDRRYAYRYPLVEWGLDRSDCLSAISRAGIKPPPKSSCFFCPAMRKREILDLRDSHPDLLRRALEIESNAATHTVKGLGRSWSWSALVKQDSKQGVLFPDASDMPCDCHDGGDDDG